jgi:hypothetical protein
LLSACVFNICEELDKEQVQENEPEVVNEDVNPNEADQEFDDIFNEAFENMGASQGFIDKQIFSPAESAFSKSAARSIFSSSQGGRDNFTQDQVLDQHDVCSYANNYILSTGDTISNLESEILENIRIPGLNRANMPSIPEKSKLIRSFERPDMYPFLTLPVEELERGLMLKSIEDSFKSKEPDYDWNFLERSIEEKFSKRILIQILSDILIWEPDMITKYFARDDSLLLGIYQRMPNDKSYNKQWKSSYKSMPDFQNWLDHFSKDSKIPLYDIDDNRVGNIKEFIQNLTPSNGGLMRIKRINVGLNEYSQVECFKGALQEMPQNFQKFKQAYTIPKYHSQI